MNEKVNQSMNQSINRSIDQSVNEFEWIWYQWIVYSRSASTAMNNSNSNNNNNNNNSNSNTWYPFTFWFIISSPVSFFSSFSGPLAPWIEYYCQDLERLKSAAKPYVKLSNIAPRLWSVVGQGWFLLIWFWGTIGWCVCIMQYNMYIYAYIYIYTHTIHVWYIYLHLPYNSIKCR